MTPRIGSVGLIRSIKLTATTNASARVSLRCLRWKSQDEKPLPTAEKSKGPNQDQLPHVSEEAASLGEITGDGGPELEQGTPIQEILERDSEAKRKAPEIMKEKASSPAPKGTRAYSTTSSQCMGLEARVGEAIPITPGHKHNLPTLPLDRTDRMRKRYDPVIAQMTNLLMEDGKLSAAQAIMLRILDHLRTSSPPQINPSRPLVPGALSSSQLPRNPVHYLAVAVDSAAPLLRIRQQKGAAGGGVALQIPIPLGLKPRRRISIKWILDAATKRRSPMSGRNGLAQNVAQELISVAEGKSTVWDRRNAVHKLGVSGRVNINIKSRR